MREIIINSNLREHIPHLSSSVVIPATQPLHKYLLNWNELNCIPNLKGVQHVIKIYGDV